MKIIKDYLIILKIKNGNTDAWEELVEKYYDLIFNYCAKRFFGNQNIAEDLTQEIFLKVISNIHSFKFSGSFFNYLFTIAVNTCNNFLKKKRFIENDLDENFLFDANTNTETIFFLDEQNKAIQKAIDRLPDYQKDPVILKFFYDMKVKEIARVTQTSIATTQSRLTQGLAKIKKILNEEDFHFE